MPFLSLSLAPSIKMKTKTKKFIVNPIIAITVMAVVFIKSLKYIRETMANVLVAAIKIRKFIIRSPVEVAAGTFFCESA